MNIYYTTVGTSLLGNARRALQTQTESKEKVVDERSLASYLRLATAADASAETNSLSRLLASGDAVVLLHSATDDGRLCARALQKHLQKDNRRVDICEIAHLNYEDKSFKQRGLAALAAALAQGIRDARRAGAEPAINATGGFKAEAAIATVVGQLFGTPVYYMHEAFRDIVELPPAPIGWDQSAIMEYEDFFDWIHADLRTAEVVEREWPNLPPAVRILLVEEEGFRILSPLGEACYEAYYETLSLHSADPINLSGKARKWYEDAEPSTRELFDRIFIRLRVPGIRHSSSHSVDNCDCFVFPSGHCYGRLFYYTNDRAVNVVEVVLHDSDYDKLIRHGVRRKNYGDFQPF